MDTYKVWSMSANAKKTAYRLEHEARISAHTRMEAIEKARKELERARKPEYVDSWSWMATRLP